MSNKAKNALQLAEEQAAIQLFGTLDCPFCHLRCDCIYPPEAGGFNEYKRLAQHILYCAFAPLSNSADVFRVSEAQLYATQRVNEEFMRGSQLGLNWQPLPLTDLLFARECKESNPEVETRKQRTPPNRRITT